MSSDMPSLQLIPESDSAKVKKINAENNINRVLVK